MEKETIQNNGEKIYFYIERKNIKNINLKVDIDKKIRVSVPCNMSRDIVKDFVKRKSDWIRKQQVFYDTFKEQKENLTFEDGETLYLLGKQYRMKIIEDKENGIEIKNNYFEIFVKEKYIMNKKYIKTVYEKWIKKYAYDIFTELVAKYQGNLIRHNITMPSIEIRPMKTRWGSCIFDKNKIILNLNLIKTPICCIEYVILHELSHFKYQNHNKYFYNFITIFMPDWKKRKQLLDEEFMGVIM